MAQQHKKAMASQLDELEEELDEPKSKPTRQHHQSSSNKKKRANRKSKQAAMADENEQTTTTPGSKTRKNANNAQLKRPPNAAKNKTSSHCAAESAAANSDLAQVFSLPEIPGVHKNKPPTATFDSIHDLYDEDVAKKYNPPEKLPKDEKLH